MGSALRIALMAPMLLALMASLAQHARAEDRIAVTVDAARPPAARIQSPWNTLTCFVPKGIPASYRDHYPMIRYICFFNATGGRPGNPEMELYDEDADGRPVYHFERLTGRTDTVLAAGFTPYLALSGSPLKLASNPDAISSSFHCTTSPPADWDKYREFIRALFRHLSDRYGADALPSWRFRCMTEQDNHNWWSGTMEEWFKFYDYTVSGARAANPAVCICPGNLMNRRTPWLTEYARRVQEGAFSIPGEMPYVPPMVTFSFYRPWRIGNSDGPMDMVHDMNAVREQLAPFPAFDGVPLGIDEGLIGVDDDNHVLWGRLDGTHLGAAYFAMLSEKLVDRRVASAPLWDAGVSEVPIAARNVLDLFQQRLADREQLSVEVDAGAATGQDQLGALAGRETSEDGRALTVMLYDYNRQRDANERQSLTVRLRGLPPGPVRVTRFAIDREHGNYRPLWLADVAHVERREASPYDVSPFSAWGPACRQVWAANRESYAGAARVEAQVDGSANTVAPDGTLLIPVELRSNSVVFLVIEPGRPAS